MLYREDLLILNIYKNLEKNTNNLQTTKKINIGENQKAESRMQTNIKWGYLIDLSLFFFA